MPPISFVKSIIVTALIAFQVGSTNLAYSLIENTNLPKETFLLMGMALLVVWTIIYHRWQKELAKKKRPAHNQKTHQRS